MLSIKFPPLEKLLEKNTGELEIDDAKRGVCIKNGHAIIVLEQGLVFFDLQGYFISTHNFNDKQSIDQLDEILNFMDGKMFTKMFWQELTSINVIRVTPEGLSLDGIVKKDLYYTETVFDGTEILMFCKTVNTDSNFNKSIVSLYMEPILNIFTGLKPMVKNDVMVLRTVGENTPVQFTFNENPWIFGIISTDASVNSKNFMFDSIKSFSESYV